MKYDCWGGVSLFGPQVLVGDAAPDEHGLVEEHLISYFINIMISISISIIITITSIVIIHIAVVIIIKTT